jgi:hypothetical protein
MGDRDFVVSFVDHGNKVVACVRPFATLQQPPELSTIVAAVGAVLGSPVELRDVGNDHYVLRSRT